MASKMEGIMLLKTKFLLAEAWNLALRKTYLQCSLFLAALKKTNLPSPLALLSITFILGQRYFLSTYVQISSHWALVLPRVTHEGKRHEPEPRLCAGIYSQAFVPGAAHLSLLVSLLLILQDQDSAWLAECLCYKGITRWHFFTPLDMDTHV